MKQLYFSILFLFNFYLLNAQCHYVVDMQDSWGDGWNGASITVNINGSQAAIMSCSGSSSIDSVKAYAGDAVEFIFASGAYDSEITFQITDPAGNSIYNSGAPSAGSFLSHTSNSSCVFQCDYLFSLQDSWGDGWNGASITMTNYKASGGVQQNSISLSNGNSGTDSVATELGDSIIFSFTSGSYDSEITFQITDPSGAQIYNGGAPSAGDFLTHISNSSCIPPPPPPVPAPIGISCNSGSPINYVEDCESQGNWTGDFGTGNGYWRVKSGSTGSSGTGPSGAHSGNSYFYFEASTGGLTTASIVSPVFDLTNSSDAELSFWLHAYGNDIGTLEVGVGNSATGPFTNVLTKSGAINTSSADPYYNAGVSLASYLGQSVYVEFKYTRGSSYEGDLAIDLVEVSSCRPITTPAGATCNLGSPNDFYTDDLESQGAWTGDFGTGNRVWRVNSGGTGSSNTGPSGAHSGSGYFFFEASSGSNSSGTIVSPTIDLTTAGEDAELSFYLHAFGSTMGTITVGVSDSGAAGPFTTVFTNSGQLQSSSTDPWTHIGVPINQYLGSSINLSFTYDMGSNYFGDLAIDLVNISACSSCPGPSNLSVANLTPNSADLSWSPGGTESVWELTYGPVGFSTGSGTLVPMLTDSNYALSGLTSNTTYDYYVKADCGFGSGSTNLSNWVGPYTFSTPCDIFNAPFFDNFDASLSSCWIQSSSDDFDWSLDANGTPSSSTGPSDDMTGGGNYLYIETSSPRSTGDSAMLISPSINLSSLSACQLTFFSHMYGASTGELRVEISDDGG